MRKAIHFIGQTAIAFAAAILTMLILHIFGELFFKIADFTAGWITCCAFIFTSQLLPKYHDQP